MEVSKNIVLSHGSCTDGFASSYLMYLYFKKLDEKTEFIPVNYNEPIPDVTDKNVYIVDFSYSKEVLEQASLKARSITMLDHHLTASQHWGSYRRFTHKCNGGCDIHITVEEHESGAGLTLEWIKNKVKAYKINTTIFEHEFLNRVVNCVQDRDLWLFKLSETKVIHEALQVIPRTFEAWDLFILDQTEEDIKHSLMRAGYYLELKESLAQRYAEKHQMIDFSGYKIPAVNCPGESSSRVGEILAKDHPFSLSFSVSSSKIYCSLRSHSKTGIDVSEIAKKFSGGGHKNASGMILKIDQLNDLFNNRL